jgi:hypothetical protein
VSGENISSVRLGQILTVLALILVAILPVTLTFDVWRQVWFGVRPQAWDGSGHFALGSIYSESIFPDTFGWTNAYFGGMPFPNFYPPLFYWCVGLLHHTGIFSFATSFKLVLLVPVLLLPVAIWTLAWRLGDRDRLFATVSALACIPILVDYRFRMVLFPSGLDYVSNFQVGLYTQSLGFILLIAWFVIYLRTPAKRWQLPAASLLLALTVLANFFNAVTATAFIAATVITNLPAKDRAGVEGRRRLRVHLVSPFLAAGLVLFWAVPMISTYRYFVTRPLSGSAFAYIAEPMWYWYLLSLVGFVLWLIRPTRGVLPFLIGCIILEAATVFSSLAPGWFPFQHLRFLSTLNLLLAVPAGYVVTVIIRAIANALVKIVARARATIVLNSAAAIVLTAALSLGLFFFIEPAYYTGSFAVGPNQQIDPVLEFAKTHQDGRYLVEHAMYTYSGSASDVRALTSYLGAQGNEALSVVFREASPNSIFFNSLVGALSNFSDAFGISSVLIEDIDFAEQPVARHLDRARFAGVKYIVAASPGIKKILAEDSSISARHDLGTWSVFEVQESPPRVEILPYKPALVLSSLSLKQRKRNEFDFVRFAEEQFVDDWFDVMLAWSNESRIDQVPELDRFGALIVEKYEYTNEDAAFEKLRSFAKTRPLILFPTSDPLCLRIRSQLAEFPHAVVVEAAPDKSDEWLESEGPILRYNESSIRKQWRQIRTLLETQKIRIDTSTHVSYEIKQEAIDLKVAGPLSESLPVLIRTSYHPNWRSSAGTNVYPTTPFFMLTFVNNDNDIIYGRSWLDWIALYCSAGLFGLACFLTVRGVYLSRE